MQNGCRFVSYKTIDIHVHSSYLENRVRTKGKNELLHHHVISMRCARALIDHSSRPIDVQKKSLCYCKNRFSASFFCPTKNP